MFHAELHDARRKHIAELYPTTTHAAVIFATTTTTTPNDSCYYVRNSSDNEHHVAIDAHPQALAFEI